VHFILVHVPHILPALVGFSLIAKLAVTASHQPPAQLSDEEIIEWRRARAEKAYQRRVRLSTSRIGLWSLIPLLLAFGTGLWLYTLALYNDRPSRLDVWLHVAVSLLALGFTAWKMADLGWARVRRGLDPRRLFTDGLSLLLAAFWVPLVITGLLLLWHPSAGSAAANVHLVASVWWGVLFGAHLMRYMGRAMDAALRGEAAGGPMPREARPAPTEPARSPAHELYNR
jgi:hypothetical protein